MYSYVLYYNTEKSGFNAVSAFVVLMLGRGIENSTEFHSCRLHQNYESAKFDPAVYIYIVIHVPN